MERREKNNYYYNESQAEKIHIYSREHLHASLLINAGVDVVTVSADLGHSTPTTNVIISYGHTTQSSYISMLKYLDKSKNI